MENGQWNLTSTSQNRIAVIIFQFVPNITGVRKKDEDYRLLAFSHLLANSEIPSIYLPQTPSYYPLKSDNPIVVSFDLFQKYQNFPIPNYLDSSTFTWNIGMHFPPDIVNDFQRSLNLYLYYLYFDLKPIYFSSFLLFRGTNGIGVPFIFKQIPIFKGINLCYRTIIHNKIDIQFECNDVKSGSYILISPYDDPFYVVESSKDKIVVLDVTFKRFEFVRSQIQFFVLLHPSQTLTEIFIQELVLSSKQQDFSKFNFLCDFRFFTPPKKPTQVTSYINSNTSLSFKDILNEEITDETILEKVFYSLGEHPIMPSTKHNIQIKRQQNLTFYELLTKKSCVIAPFFTRNLTGITDTNFLKLGIPFLVVRQGDRLIEVSADKIIGNWDSMKYLPISGKKSVYYVIFAELSNKTSSIKNFMRQLAHYYSKYGFGELKEFPRNQNLYTSQSKELFNTISTFCKENKSIEFSKYQTVGIYINNSYDIRLDQFHMNFFYINSSMIHFFASKKIKSLAFMLYSRIRLYFEHPEGFINLQSVNKTDIKIDNMFFGFRYQPIFILKRQNENVLKMSVCWDTETKVSIWMDDIGSVLSKFNVNDVVQMDNVFDELRNKYSNIKIEITLFVLGEGITHDNVASFSRLNFVKVFTISPALHVQINTKINTNDDICLITQHEQALPTTGYLEKPLASCFVVAKNHQPYIVSYYLPKSGEDPNKILLSSVRELSHLSWLSVMPNYTNRTTSFPPHLANLIVHSSKLNFYSNFSFLNDFE